MPQFPHLYNGNDSNNEVVVKTEYGSAQKYLENLLAERKHTVSITVNTFVFLP